MEKSGEHMKKQISNENSTVSSLLVYTSSDATMVSPTSPPLQHQKHLHPTINVDIHLLLYHGIQQFSAVHTHPRKMSKSFGCTFLTVLKNSEGQDI